MVPGIRLSMLMVISAEPKRAVTRFGELFGRKLEATSGALLHVHGLTVV